MGKRGVRAPSGISTSKRLYPISPKAIAHARAETGMGSFMVKATIVARPIGVIPTIMASGSILKWSLHSWRRGWNRSTQSPVTGSTAWILSALWRLQKGHCSTRLLMSVSPPWERGTMWSMWKVAPCPNCASQQYRHVPASLRETSSRSDLGIVERLTDRSMVGRWPWRESGQTRPCGRAFPARAARWS